MLLLLPRLSVCTISSGGPRPSEGALCPPDALLLAGNHVLLGGCELHICKRRRATVSGRASPRSTAAAGLLLLKALLLEERVKRVIALASALSARLLCGPSGHLLSASSCRWGRMVAGRSLEAACWRHRRKRGSSCCPLVLCAPSGHGASSTSITNRLVTRGC